MKTIQQILEEERLKSKLDSVSEAKINRTLANKAKAEDPIIKEKLSQSTKEYWKNNPNQKQISAERLKKTNEKLFNDPNYRKELKGKRQEQAKDPIYLEKLKKGIENRDKDETYKENRKKGYEKRKSNDQWIKNIKLSQSNRSEEHQKNQYRSKAYPIQTPDGLFEGLKEAHIFYNKKKDFNNGRRWTLHMMKKDPSRYYKITWEEFDKIKK